MASWPSVTVEERVSTRVASTLGRDRHNERTDKETVTPGPDAAVNYRTTQAVDARAGPKHTPRRARHPVPPLDHPAGHPEIELAPVTAHRMRAWETAYGSKFIFSGSPAAYRAFPTSGIAYSRYTKQWRLVHYVGHFSEIGRAHV